ncbi:MAG: efflux RND transporter periplasmic adaptor subunit [Dehalococcoidales bacterium]|nr:efflux RND transporter periplasmic adaptor subunit [Dehalococcoidales bacterium]
MKGWRVVTVLLLSLVITGAISCNPFGGEEEGTKEIAEVVRGDLMVTISGSGNIEVANEIKLTFGVAGKIDRIYVGENDEVKKGDVLAKLETTDLELALAQAQVARTKAAVDITQAQVTLQTAEYNLEQTEETYTLSDIKAAQADVDTVRRDFEDALWTLSKYDPGTPGWDEQQKLVNQARLRLNAAEDTLDAMLLGTDTQEMAIKKSQVEAARHSLELAEESLALADQSLAQAEKNLREATITAPFDGVVADVAVDEKDTITTATKIIHLIDPGSMELKAEVDEIDVTGVMPGQKAIIELDALVGLPIEGKVSSVSLLSREEGGVITYDVTIEFETPENSGIRTGMSATADIVIAERTNVLLVPDRAVKQDNQGNSVVEVSVNGQIEGRPVVTGISDGFQTEIIEGLEEGETVVRN